VDGRPPELVPKDVGHRLGDDLVARLGQRAERDLIRHRRGREEDGLLLAEQLGGALLECNDGRVLAFLLVSDGRFGDGLAHAGGWLRDGVRAKVDHDLTVPLYSKNVSSSRYGGAQQQRMRSSPASSARS
jgi:hypothetical protein